MYQSYLKIAPVALALSILTACTQAPPPPPPDTRAADEKTIRDYESQWAKEFTAKDMDKVLAHYADDGSVLMPDIGIMTGKDAIRGGLKDFLADPAFTLDLQTAKVEVSKGSDIAYSQGTYAVTFTDPKAKKVMTEKGKYVEVYRKQADGSWKVAEDINNADAPAAPSK